MLERRLLAAPSVGLGRTTIDDVSPVRAAVQVVGRRMDAEDYRLRVAAAVGEGSMVAALVFSRLNELGVTV